MLRESVNEVIEAFERLVETMEENGTDPSILEIVEDAKTAFLEMHDDADDDALEEERCAQTWKKKRPSLLSSSTNNRRRLFRLRWRWWWW